MFNILRSNSFAVSRNHIDKLLYLSSTAIVNSALSLLERYLFSGKISASDLVRPPLFVLGHWRHGTTFLHNLLVQDPSHTCPRFYQVMFPGYFLLPGLDRVIDRMNVAVPLKTRPMDNVKFGMYEPWEDEHSMAALTGMSPYIRYMFPRTQGREVNYRYPDFQSQAEQTRWEKTFVRFLKRLNLIENRNIVLKSPPHTARIKTLLKLFPEAKFIHIIRHPYDVFPSTPKMWRDTLSFSTLQTVSQEEVVEIVLTTYEQIYRRYHQERSCIPQSNLIEIKFEDLEKDPIRMLDLIYYHLNLRDFRSLYPRVSNYLSRIGRYHKSEYKLNKTMKKLIKNRWSITFDTYRYGD
ncbi:MAG: hypothetical protein GTN76_04960 [Candidatus Aenigmarchaeota archaeon]|nr:hypothetical protein [Candidatus Aenigmarchaeota archaeon]